MLDPRDGMLPFCFVGRFVIDGTDMVRIAKHGLLRIRRPLSAKPSLHRAQGRVMAKLDGDAGYRVSYAYGGDAIKSEADVRAALEERSDDDITYSGEQYTAWAGFRNAGLFLCFLRALRAWRVYEPWNLVVADDGPCNELSNRLCDALRLYATMDGVDVGQDRKMAAIIYGAMGHEFPLHERFVTIRPEDFALTDGGAAASPPARAPESAPKAAPKAAGAARAVRRCVHCGHTSTPMWRTGPEGPGTLCNACSWHLRQGKLMETKYSQFG